MRDFIIGKKRFERDFAVAEFFGIDVVDKIYVNEFLQDLLRRTKAKGAATSHKYVWIRTRVILVRRDNEQPIINITSDSDLSKFFMTTYLPSLNVAQLTVNNVAPACTILLITQFNANSLLGHISFIRAHFSIHFAHIISISETWLHPGLPDVLVDIPGYFLIRNDRVSKVGGEVACCIHNPLKVKLVAASPAEFVNSPEYL